MAWRQPEAAAIGHDDDIHIETDKLGGEDAEAVELTLCVSMLDADASSFYPSQIPQTFPECIYLS
jgi:hypothetical protein